MSNPDAQDDFLLVEAYCDGELDAGAALAMERRLANEPRLKVHQARVMAVSAGIASAVQPTVMADDVRERISSTAMGGTGQPVVKAKDPASRFTRSFARSYDGRQMAASVVAAALIASGATALVIGRAVPSSDIAAVISGHQRALLAASPVDIASGDRHTVKPWFDAKLAISPRVPDLAAAGFPLAGGRIDIAGGKAVPTLVYRRREHLISVTAVPKPGARDAGGADVHEARDGFAAETWAGQGFAYTAVSDIPAAELEAFCDAWRTAAAM